MNHRHRKDRRASDCTSANCILSTPYNFLLTTCLINMIHICLRVEQQCHHRCMTISSSQDERCRAILNDHWMTVTQILCKVTSYRAMCHCKMHHDNVDTLSSISCTVHMHMEVSTQTQILHRHTSLSHYYHSHTPIDACSSRLNVSYQTRTVNVCLRV